MSAQNQVYGFHVWNVDTQTSECSMGADESNVMAVIAHMIETTANFADDGCMRVLTVTDDTADFTKLAES